MNLEFYVSSLDGLELAYFLAAVFLSAFDFSETFQHASSALIFFASDHIFDLT